MNTLLFKAYKKARAQMSRGDSLPTFPGSATSALAYARGALKSESFARALNVPRYLSESETFELPGGARLVYTCDADECGDFADNLGLPVEWARGYTWGSVALQIENAPDWWIDRDGKAYARGDRGHDRAVITSGYPLAERIADKRKRMARNAAHVTARQDLAREFETARDYWTGRENFLYCRVRLFDKSGALVADDACGGITSGDNYPRDWFLESAAQLLREYELQCMQDICNARDSIRARRARAKKLIKELRGVARLKISPPEICDVLRAHVANMRAAISDGARTIRENKRTVLALMVLQA